MIGLSLDADFTVDYTHRLRFTAGVWASGNQVLAKVVASGSDPSDLPVRVQVFVDEGVIRAWPLLIEQVDRYCGAHASAMTLRGGVSPVPGGEVCKNDRAIVDGVLQSIHDAQLCRRSYVVAVGGGAVLDAVGFAASIAHRGVRLIRMPTTTLAQADSGVGVKNGVNAFGKKNYLGTFIPPWAVIHDERFLETLADRDWRGGFSEAVKVALVKDRSFFNHIVATIGGINQRDPGAACPIIRRSTQLHLMHIVNGGDPFELTAARPLDMGHWAAHKLEQMTGFELRHGEAVAIGLAVDTLYSNLMGLLSDLETQAVLGALSRLGFTLFHEAMHDTDELLTGLNEFREHLGGRLTVTLLQGIGQPVDVHSIDPERMVEAIARLAVFEESRFFGDEPWAKELGGG